MGHRITSVITLLCNGDVAMINTLLWKKVSTLLKVSKVEKSSSFKNLPRYSTSPLNKMVSIFNPFKLN